MNGYQRESQMPKRGYRVPKWIVVLAIIGIFIAISSGYNTGSMVKYYYSHMTLPDTNGKQDSSLTRLNFSNFINKNSSEDYYNEFDHTGLFALGYSSNAEGDIGKTYNNDYTGRVSVDIRVNFRYFTYYDICYVNKNTDGKTSLNYDVLIDITSGNMEAAILEIDRDYKCVFMNGKDVIDQQYVTEAVRITGAGEKGTIPLKADKIYIIAFAGENANGSYTLSVTLQ